MLERHTPSRGGNLVNPLSRENPFPQSCSENYLCSPTPINLLFHSIGFANDSVVQANPQINSPPDCGNCLSMATWQLEVVASVRLSERLCME